LFIEKLSSTTATNRQVSTPAKHVNTKQPEPVSFTIHLSTFYFEQPTAAAAAAAEHDGPHAFAIQLSQRQFLESQTPIPTAANAKRSGNIPPTAHCKHGPKSELQPNS